MRRGFFVELRQSGRGGCASWDIMHHGAADLGVDIRALYMAGAMRPRAFNFSEEAGDGGLGWTLWCCDGLRGREGRQRGGRGSEGEAGQGEGSER